MFAFCLYSEAIVSQVLDELGLQMADQLQGKTRRTDIALIRLKRALQRCYCTFTLQLRLLEN